MINEIKNSFINFKMLCVILIATGLLFFELFAIEKVHLNDWSMFDESRICIICDVISLSIFTLVAGMFPGIPYSQSFILEKESGYYRYKLIRTKTKRYIATKILCAGLSGAVAMVIPYILLCIPVYAMGSKVILGENVEVLVGTVWNDVLIKYGDNLVIVLKGVLFMLFGILWSEFALLMSIMISNKYLAFVMPYIIYELLFFSAYNSIVIVINPRFMLRYDVPDNYPIVLPYIMFFIYIFTVILLIYNRLKRYIYNE